MVFVEGMFVDFKYVFEIFVGFVVVVLVEVDGGDLVGEVGCLGVFFGFELIDVDVGDF